MTFVANKIRSGALDYILFNRNKLIHILLLLFLFFILQHEYKNFVFLLFHDTGFDLSIDIYRSILSKVLMISMLILLLLLNHSPFIYVMNIVILILFVYPNLILYEYGNISLQIPLFMTLFYLSVNIKYFKKDGLSFIPVFKSIHQEILLLVILLIFITPFIIKFGAHFDYSVFSLGSVIYKIRASVTAQYNTFIAYGFGQLTKAILPVSILYGLLKRKHVIWIVGSLAMLYIFLIIPQKSVVFSLLILFVFVFNTSYYNKVSIFVISFVFLVVSTIIISHSGEILPESIIVRRFLFLPGLITDKYFHFFAHKPLYLSNSIFSFLEYPYDLQPPFLIGKVYFNSPGASFNTGFIGDAFMNFGYAGVVGAIFIVSLIINYIDRLKMHPGYFGLAFLLLFQLSNSGLFTSLLTHGCLLLLLFMTFFLKTNKEIGR